jgi:Na+-driven multidrug efflux pump
MATQKAAQLGQLPIGKLLLQQSVPASIGILAMSINILVDTIFVGQWIGADAIAAINVVLPVSFFIGALRNGYWYWGWFDHFQSLRQRQC